MTSKLQDKQEAFLSELNERLPRGIHAQYRPSESNPPWPNVLNVLIYGGNMGLELFGLTLDGNGEVWYFQNLRGVLY